MAPLDRASEREGRAGNIVAQGRISPIVLHAGDWPDAMCERVFHRRPFRADIQTELCAVPADRVEVDRARAFDAPPVGSRDVADPLPVEPDRNDVYDVRNTVIVSVKPRFSPSPEIVRNFGLGLPALRRDQLRIAGVLPVRAEVRLGKKVVEADLPDAPAKFEADVPILRRVPPQRQASLGPKELPRRLAVGHAVKTRDFASGGELHVEVLGEWPAECRQRLVAQFGHLAAPFGKRHWDVVAPWAELRQPALLVEVVERPLERNLPVVRGSLPVIFGTADHFAQMSVATEPHSERIRAGADEPSHVGRDERLMLPVADAD